jgi:hypothetical protein
MNDNGNNNDNIFNAVVLLIKELNESNLEKAKKEIERKLSNLILVIFFVRLNEE